MKLLEKTRKINKLLQKEIRLSLTLLQSCCVTLLKQTPILSAVKAA